MLAVIETGNKQYIVKENDIIDIDTVQINKDDTITFSQVLLISEENV